MYCGGDGGGVESGGGVVREVEGVQFEADLEPLHFRRVQLHQYEGRLCSSRQTIVTNGSKKTFDSLTSS